MAKNYEFDSDTSGSEEKSIEIEIIDLWDNLPDYCKTAQTLEKIKSMAGPSLWNKLTMQEALDDC
jgi:hypothetical protein